MKKVPTHNKIEHLHKRKINKVGFSIIGCRGFLHWKCNPKQGWSISYGTSRFLVAEGSFWSINVGKELFNNWTEIND